MSDQSPSSLLCRYCSVNGLANSSLNFDRGCCLSCGILTTGGSSLGKADDTDVDDSYQIEFKREEYQFVNVEFLREMELKGQHIATLNLCSCVSLTNRSLQVVAQHCAQIRVLGLADCAQIKDGSLISVAKANASIEDVNLSVKPHLESLLTDAAILAFAEHCAGITRLNISGCTNLTDTALAAVGQACSGLVDLNASGCPALTDAAFVGISKNGTISTLRIRGCSHVTDESVVEMAEHCALRVLDFRLCRKITDKGLIQVAEASRGLISIDIRGCEFLTDNSLEKLVDNCALLQNIFLDDSCEGLTISPERASSVEAVRGYYDDLQRGKLQTASIAPTRAAGKVLIQLAFKAPALLKLDMDGAHEVTDAGLRAVGAYCHSIEKLNVSDCPSVTNDGIVAVGWGCPNLLELRMRELPQVTSEALLALAGAAKRALERLEKDLLPLPSGEHEVMSLGEEDDTCAAQVVKQLRDEEVAQELTWRGLPNDGEDARRRLAVRLEKERQVRRLQRATRPPSTFDKLMGDTSFGSTVMGGEVAQDGLKATKKGVDVGANFTKGLGDSVMKKVPFTQTRNGRCLTPNLRYLDVSGCRQMSSDGLVGLSVFCNLEHLACWKLCRAVSGARKIPKKISEDLCAIAENSPDLRHLDLDEVRGVSDDVIRALANSCPKLENLNVSMCTKITDKSMLQLITKCKSLERLKIENCELLSMKDSLKNCVCVTDQERQRHTKKLIEWFMAPSWERKERGEMRKEDSRQGSQ